MELKGKCSVNTAVGMDTGMEKDMNILKLTSLRDGGDLVDKLIKTQICTHL